MGETGNASRTLVEICFGKQPLGRIKGDGRIILNWILETFFDDLNLKNLAVLIWNDVVTGVWKSFLSINSYVEHAYFAVNLFSMNLRCRDIMQVNAVVLVTQHHVYFAVSIIS
jgi:hypothetical protein